MSYEKRFRELLETIERWAEDFEVGEPLGPDAIARRQTCVRPHFGDCRWTVPPSYAAFLGVCGSIEAGNEDDERGYIGIHVFDEATMAETNSDLVHLPQGVSRDGPDLSTNHFVGFAAAGQEGVWCFYIDSERDELPVFFHHQDDPRAKFVETGEWESEEQSHPDYESFADWLEAHVDDLINNRGRRTASS